MLQVSLIKPCPQWQLDRDKSNPHRRWFRLRSDHNQLIPIRNCGHYLHICYECSQNIPALSSSVSLTLHHCINAFHKQRTHTYTLVVSHVMPNKRRRSRFQSAVWTLANPIGSRTLLVSCGQAFRSHNCVILQ